jgi:hypothetical protein
MLRLVLFSLLVGAAGAPLAAQIQNNMPAAGTNPMGASSVPMEGVVWPPAFALPGWRRAIAARPDQVRIGSIVRSTEGDEIGRVAYVDAKVAVVKSPRWAMRLPLKAFGIDQKGLLLALTPTSFDKLAEAHGARTN